MRLKSTATSDIVAAAHRISPRLPCPLIITALPTDFFEHAAARGARDCDVLVAASSRLYSLVLPSIPPKWKARLARIPWVKDETRMYSKIRYRADEEATLHLLRNEGSASCSIYSDLHLTRSVVKETLTKLQNDRRKQVVFAGIVCATRFKMIAPNNELHAVKCMRCGEQDSFPHMLQCCNLGTIPDAEDLAELFAFLLRLIWEAARGAPVIPIRFLMPALDEISLVMDDEGEASLQLAESENSLSFDEGDEVLSAP